MTTTEATAGTASTFPPPRGLLIREAAPDERALVHEITQQAYAEHRPAIGDSGVFRETLAQIGERQEQGWVLLLAEVDGQPAGAARIIRREGQLYLGRLAVLPQQRRRGIGQALVGACEAWGRAWGLAAVQLGAREALPQNRRFYEQLGYQAGEPLELNNAPGSFFRWLRKPLSDLDPTRATAQTYERYAPSFAARSQGYGWASMTLDRFAQVAPPPGRVGAIGCGPGPELLALRARGYTPVGVDRTMAMLRMAANTGSELARADLRALPFQGAALDGVWASASLLHLPRAEIAIALHELRAAVRPGGALLLSLKMGGGEELRPTQQGPRLFGLYQPDEVRRLLHGARFAVVYQWSQEPWTASQDAWVLTVGRAE
jgi:GNAT superfamily N-acetyltransferase/SAM-dependent methyltransferase